MYLNSTHEIRGDKTKWEPKQEVKPINIGSQTRRVSTKFTPEVNVFSSGHKSHGDNESFQQPSFENLKSAFLTLAEARLTDTQKFLLKMSESVLKHRSMSVTALADVLSRRSKIPYSTTKWNLRSLMDLGLMIGGDIENRGLNARLTPCAELVVRHLDAGRD